MPVPKGVSKEKFDSCIEQVKRKQGKKVNAYAVCNSSLDKAEIGFDKLVDKLSNEKNRPDNPKAVAAAIGRKKYGKKKFQEAAEEGHKVKKAIVEEVYKKFEGQSINEEEIKMEIKKALTSTSGDGTNAPVVEPATEVTQNQAAPAAEPVAEVKPTLARGLFQGYTLGATLKQGPTGNVMSNMKKPMMDYEKTYNNSTKNQKLTGEQLSQIKQNPSDKK